MKSLVAAVVVCLIAPLAAQALAADKARGRILYEARCVGCHSESVHRRESRKARSFDAIRAQVARWDAAQGGVWKSEEIDDVAVYLNDSYYGYPCPAQICLEQKAALRPGR
ncbi:MAG: cytochrome c [Burkholderiales bacterium]|nr:MAG: cytochrome c [Burkholderiales bacterium]